MQKLKAECREVFGAAAKSASNAVHLAEICRHLVAAADSFLHHSSVVAFCKKKL
jgi:hypothetical protein